MADTGGPNTGPPDTGGGGFLTRKMAGLPTWGWLGISASVGIVLLVWMQNRKKNAVPPVADTTSPQVVDSSGLATGQYESVLALLRDIQGQPSEELPGPAGPAGPPGPGGPTGPPGTAPPPPALTAPTGVHTINDRVWRNFLELHWNPVPGATSYVIRGAGTDRGSGGPVTGIMVGNLVPDGSYFLSVAAKDAAGNIGPFSQPTNSHTKK